MGNGSVLDYIEELNTSKITEYVLSDDFSKEAIALLKDDCENNPLTRGHEEFAFKSIKCYFDLFMKALNDQYKITKFDFEDIIYFFDAVPSFFLSEDQKNKDLKENFLIRMIRNTFKLEIKQDICENLFLEDIYLAIPNIIRILILRYINQLVKNNVNAINDFKADFGIFVKYLKSKFDFINIYSLNYDPLVYEALKDDVDFANAICFKEGQFDKKGFFNSQKTIAFPHGHVGFYPKEDDNKIEFTHDYDCADKKRVKRLIGSNGVLPVILNGIEYNYNFNLMMIAGKDKLSTFELELYASYYQKLITDIKKSDLVYIIGYSFRDFHINFALKDMQDDNRRLILVDTLLNFNPFLLPGQKKGKMYLLTLEMPSIFLYEEGAKSFFRSFL